SVGIRFAAVEVTAGAPGPIQPLVTCCAPNKSVEECQAECGDGKVTGNELCDIALSPGRPGACPTNCDPSDSCQRSFLHATGCVAQCVEEPIMTFVKGDGCCPPQATASQDSDCTNPEAAKLCGNGLLETGETCDQAKGACPTCTVPTNACVKLETRGSR